MDIIVMVIKEEQSIQKGAETKHARGLKTVVCIQLQS